jgi:hypothetical protein
VRDAAGDIVVLVRGELLHRFPGTALLAVRGVDGELPKDFAGTPGTPLALDESTVLYLVPGLTPDRAVAEGWFFVFREPMRGTQFGFDSGAQPPTMATWADLTWSGLSTPTGFVEVGRPPASPQRPEPTTRPSGAATPPTWPASPSNSRSSSRSAQLRC